MKLDLQVVLPLIDIIQQDAVALNNSLAHNDGRMRRSLTELDALLALFSPDFFNTGNITIGEAECPAILRSCSFLRLHLWQKHLSTIPDAALETADWKIEGASTHILPGGGLDVEEGEPCQVDPTALLCYQFLATIQMLAVEKLAPGSTALTSTPTFRRIFSRIRSCFHPRRALATNPVESQSVSNKELWLVVVHNDPVNTMAYVATVFERVIGLTPKIARERMREVHELKCSIVWRGPRGVAEHHALVLQSWHLKTELRRSGPG